MLATKSPWLKKSAWALATASFLVVACEKNILNTGPVDYDEKATTDATVASVPYDDASVIVDLAYEGNYNGKNSDVLSCAVITVDTLTSAFHRVIIDFGTGCTDAAGNVRTGQIKATFTVPRIAAGAVTDLEFINYTFNQVAIAGIYHQVFTGLNTANQPEWAVDIDGSAAYSPGDTLFYESTRTRTWIDGFNPFIPSNIKFAITGAASGQRTGQPQWIATVKDDLIWKYGCPWLVEGKYEISVGNSKIYEVDFGNGDCDDEATVSGNGGSIIIQL